MHGWLAQVSVTNNRCPAPALPLREKNELAFQTPNLYLKIKDLTEREFSRKFIDKEGERGTMGLELSTYVFYYSLVHFITSSFSSLLSAALFVCVLFCLIWTDVYSTDPFFSCRC
jgi:hypothetical protein